MGGTRTRIMVALAITFILTNPPWLARIVFGVRPGVSMSGVPVGGMLPREVNELVRMMSRSERIPPVDATICRDDGRIIPERRGVEVDVAATVTRVMAVARNTEVTPSLAAIDPRVLASDLARATRVLGEFSTGVGGSENRAGNVGLATELLNWTVVEPYGLMSFNRTVGPRSAERGFKPAPVLISGGSGMDYGGGVCQVSSTLYNAVLSAQLEVAERYPHSKPVHYVPPGRDATVAHDYLDFKFVNPLPTPVIVRGELKGRHLRIWISGVAMD